MATDFDLLVIGAGVVGLATARAAALAGLSTLVLERHRHIGSEISSRNSEVIHAGIYYPAGSLKARTCVAGRDALYSFAANADVPIKKCGKLIVATSASQEEALLELRAGGAANGVNDLVIVGAGELARDWPDLRATRALLSPSTGIVDAHAFMLALLGEAEANGAQLVVGQNVDRVARRPSGWAIHVEGQQAPAVTTRLIVNATGLSAPSVAREIEGYKPERAIQEHLAKGSYFSYSGPTPFSQLIYPVPEPGGLGIHLTLDLANRARFGPNVEWVNSIDYDVDASLRSSFAAAIRSYWPGVDGDRLHPDYAGVRPKISGPGEPAADFVIEGEPQHGLPGIVNLFGIESPGLTASMALADAVINHLRSGAMQPIKSV